MKLLLIIFQLISFTCLAQKSIYDIPLTSADGSKINMADFKGKKILIAAVSPDNIQSSAFSFLDSLQTANPGIVVIAIPAKDFGGSENAEIISAVNNNKTKKSWSLHFRLLKKR